MGSKTGINVNFISLLPDVNERGLGKEDKRELERDT